MPTPPPVIDAPSPNFDRRQAAAPTFIMLHYTGMPSGQEALARLRDPAAKVSAHYLVEENGRIFSLVAEEQRAWHAGAGSYAGITDMNSASVGIEIVNPGHYWGYRDFPDVQIETVLSLVTDISARWKISPSRIIGHSDFAPHRKEDPGERFPWAMLAAEGLALPPVQGPGLIEGEPPEYETVLRMLSDIGYDVDRFGPSAVCLAFQRRFCSTELAQALNPATRRAIAQVHGQVTTG